MVERRDGSASRAIRRGRGAGEPQPTSRPVALPFATCDGPQLVGVRRGRPGPNAWPRVWRADPLAVGCPRDTAHAPLGGGGGCVSQALATVTGPQGVAVLLDQVQAEDRVVDVIVARRAINLVCVQLSRRRKPLSGVGSRTWSRSPRRPRARGWCAARRGPVLALLLPRLQPAIPASRRGCGPRQVRSPSGARHRPRDGRVAKLMRVEHAEPSYGHAGIRLERVEGRLEGGQRACIGGIGRRDPGRTMAGLASLRDLHHHQVVAAQQVRGRSSGGGLQNHLRVLLDDDVRRTRACQHHPRAEDPS